MSFADELLADLGGDDGYESDPQEEEGQGGPAGDVKVEAMEEDEDTFAIPTGLPNKGKGKRKFDDLGDEEEDGGGGGGQDATLSVPSGGTRPADELDKDDVEKMELVDVEDVRSVAKLWYSKSTKECLQKVEFFSGQAPSPDMVLSDDSEEYRLIVEANNLVVKIDNELLIVHKFVRDHYNTRFPSLDQLIPEALEYCRAVKAIGNPEDLATTTSETNLRPIVNAATQMIVAMTASENRGRQLSDGQWKMVIRACDLAWELDGGKRKILLYVESRMSLLAPNLSAIVGTRTATKLLGIAGGLVGLSKIPACNIHLLGAAKRVPQGLSHGAHSVARRHTGFVYQSDPIQETPEEYRMKGQRTLGAKCVLAARMDVGRGRVDGSYGIELRDDFKKKMEKLAEPPPSKSIKALPIPDDGPKKRRGGKRAAKAKEAYAQTELMKLRNRTKFGEAEEEAGEGEGDETMGMGMIGGSSGRLRANLGDSRTKAKLSKANKNRLAMLRGGTTSTFGGTSSSISGTASSVSFTPHQGLELVADKKDDKAREANAKWFAEGSFSIVR